jgi:chemotaxis protein MotB
MDRRSGWTRFAAGGTLVMLAAVVAAGCGVSKAQYLEITKSRDDLTSKNQQLQSSLDAANGEKTQLATDKAALEARVQEMESTAQQLGTELEKEKQSAADLKSTYESMVGSLQGELSSGQVTIQQLRDGISVNLAQDILFPSGSAELDKGGRELLLKVSDQLKQSPFLIIVMGHTDNQKIRAGLATRYPTNWELGGARASRIVRLFEEAGIAKDRLSALSLADSRPRAANDTPEGRAQNRRIEIRLRPVASEQEPTATN